jgi:hypothetical protein
MNHYTYFLTAKEPFNGMKYYIGVRSCEGSVEEDKYMGSSKVIKHNKITVEKHILATWKTREEAVSHEILLHECFDVARNPEFFNQAKQKAVGFDTAGKSFNVGVKFSEERKQAMSEKTKTYYKNNPEKKEQVRKQLASVIIPKEAYERQSKIISSLIWMNDGIRSYRVRPEHVTDKINSGLVQGRLMSFIHDKEYKMKQKLNATKQWQKIKAAGFNDLKGRK